MMLIPIVVCAVALGWLIGQKSKEEPKHFSKVSGYLPPSSDSPLDQFTQVIRSGQRPSAWLVSEAVRDAYEQGKWEIASQIAISYDLASPLPSALSELTSEVVSESPESDASSDAQGDSAPPAPESSSPSSAPGTRSFASPINGIAEDDWSEFVNHMADKTEDFADEKAVGMFYHNRQRLAQLGIEPAKLVTADEQYKAFATDIVDHFNKNRKFLADIVDARFIMVDGAEQNISLSGALALLKAAGPENARKWIDDNERDKKYPNTYKLFTRCNNLF